MIRHIVMFKLKATEGMSEYDNAAEAKKRFDDVIANVKELKKGELVINSKDADQSNYTVSLICDFDDIDGLNAYQVHPAHVNFAKFLGTVKTDRACIDYEFNV
ncbi:MAG: Dabb family protein [Ruminococcus sp.]|nr:Dabb family protein [Ruminococcus sp.]MBP3268379.1 Dabb family protein [Ruminococcus sp.]